jgi:hypothetical protein
VPDRSAIARRLSSPAGIAWSGALLLPALLALRLPAALDGPDSVNFALGLRDFDPLLEQPHFPGYPVYIALCRLLALAGVPEARALALPGVLASAALVPALVALGRRFAVPVTTLALASLLLAAQPLVFSEGPRPAPDLLATVCAGLALALAAQRRSRRRGGARSRLGFASICAAGVSSPRRCAGASARASRGPALGVAPGSRRSRWRCRPRARARRGFAIGHFSVWGSTALAGAGAGDGGARAALRLGRRLPLLAGLGARWRGADPEALPAPLWGLRPVGVLGQNLPVPAIASARARVRAVGGLRSWRASSADRAARRRARAALLLAVDLSPGPRTRTGASSAHASRAPAPAAVRRFAGRASACSSTTPGRRAALPSGNAGRGAPRSARVAGLVGRSGSPASCRQRPLGASASPGRGPAPVPDRRGRATVGALRSFNLLRYFTVASLAVIAALALATAWVFSRNLENSLTEEAGLYAVDMSNSLNRAIFREFLEPLAREGTAVDLENPSQRARLAGIVELHTRGMRILTVNIFDKGGTIIYSTSPTTSATARSTIRARERARRPRRPTEARRARGGSDPPGHDLLESYAPFTSSPGSETLGRSSACSSCTRTRARSRPRSRRASARLRCSPPADGRAVRGAVRDRAARSRAHRAALRGTRALEPRARGACGRAHARDRARARAAGVTLRRYHRRHLGDRG